MIEKKIKPFLVLFEPEIPYNVGLIIRLSACFKSKLVIIRPFSFIWDEKKLKNSSIDYIDKVEIIFFDSFEEFKKNHNGRIIGTAVENSCSYSKFKFQENDAILMGKESVGLPENIANQVQNIRIDIYERSLNLAIASSILLSQSHLQMI